MIPEYTYFKNKECSRCGLLLPSINFEVAKNGKKNGKQQYKLQSKCKSCNKKNELFKKCNICNKELPKTNEFFPQKIIKQKNKNGIVEYKSFKHCCFVCYRKYISKIQRERYRNPKIKEKENKRCKIWRDNNPEKVKELTLNWRKKNRNKILERDRKRVSELDDSWVASTIGISLNEIPKEVLEFTKLIIKLKRELKANNIKS